MRSTPIVSFQTAAFVARQAVSAEVPHETASPAPIAPLSLSAPGTTTGPLRCECTPVTPSEWHWSERRKIGLATIGFGVLSGTVGFAFAWSAQRSWFQATQHGQTTAFAAERSLRDRYAAAGVLISVAGLSALVGAALVLWPESHNVSVTVVPSGGALVSCGGEI